MPERSPYRTINYNLNPSVTLAAGYTLAVGVIFAVLQVLFPYGLDALMFNGIYRSYCSPDAEFSFSAWGEYIKIASTNDNLRFAQAFWPFFTFWLPGFFIPVLTGASIFYMIYAACRMIAPQQTLKNSFTAGNAVIYTVVLLVSFPWWGFLLCPLYVLNYLCPAVTGLYLLRILTRQRHKKHDTVRIILVSILLCCFHEGFALFTGMAIALYWLVRRGHIDRKYYWCFATLTVFTSLFVFGTAMFRRAGKDFSSPMIISETFKWVAVNIVSIVAIFLTLMAVLWKGRRRKLFNAFDRRPVMLLCFGIGCAGMLISAMMRFNWRISAWAELCAGIYICQLLYPGWRNIRPLLRKSLTVISAIFLGCFFFNAIFQATKFKKEYDSILRAIADSPTGTVPTEYDPYQKKNFIYFTMGLVGTNVWNHPFQFNSLHFYFGNGKWPAIVPPVLDRDLNAVTDYNTINTQFDIRRLKNGLYMPLLSDDPNLMSGNLRGNVTFADGRTQYGVRILFNRFTDASGTEWFLIYPFKTSEPLENITSITSAVMEESRHRDFYPDGSKVHLY